MLTAGGQVLLPAMDVLDVGRMAVFSDPQGAVFSVWQAGTHPGAELVNERQEKATQREEREKLAKVVFLKKGNKAQQVKVTTGIADDTYMEIKSGLQPGEEVISGSYSAISRKLKEGAKVTYDKEVTK